MRFVATILCVDDDDDDQLFIKEAINSYGKPFHIVEAKNGWDALTFLNESLAKEELPCLVIMDMNMPKMDGTHTIKKIKEIEGLREMPIAVFTTSSNLADKEYFETNGIHFLTKSFDYKIFTKEIVDLLGFCARLGE